MDDTRLNDAETLDTSFLEGRMELKVLNPERIKELREAKQAGQDVDIKAELEKEENKQEEVA